MYTSINITYEKKPCYDLVISDSFNSLSEEWGKIDIKNRRVAIITDSNVKPLYADTIKTLFKEICVKCEIFCIEAGEQSKTLEIVESIYEFLITNHFDRHDLLVALGGGVVGDITGYTASTYLRGIDFMQIPTTLLAQSDSSIGGKTGVDFKSFKNMIGSFYMPKLVYINIEVLKSLDDRQFYNGFAEIMKHGLIKDSSFYEWLIDHLYEICERDMDSLFEMIKWSCEIKKAIVEKDPDEKGERMLLNFGHTIGHAIEKELNFTLLHGECVSLGIVCSAFISWKHSLLSMEEYYEIRDMFVPFNLPISIENLNMDSVLQITKNDKKMINNRIRFILLKKVGKAIVDESVSDEDILSALKEINFSMED